MFITQFCLLFVLLSSTSSLRCYKGYALLKGSSIGNTTKECGKETDFCYNATADVASFSTIQKAGCNTVLCQYSMNECVEKNITGIPVKFCCCNTGDYCNKGEQTEELGIIDKGATLLKALNDILG
ncbi:hypothetical protein V3C99_005011 [Haemonchus contortus]